MVQNDPHVITPCPSKVQIYYKGYNNNLPTKDNLSYMILRGDLHVRFLTEVSWT